MPSAECRVPNCRDAAVLALRSHCHLLAIGKAVRMMMMISMMPMVLITLMMPLMLMMLVMLAMAPMLARGHRRCLRAGVAADGGGEPSGDVAWVPSGRQRRGCLGAKARAGVLAQSAERVRRCELRKVG